MLTNAMQAASTETVPMRWRKKWGQQMYWAQMLTSQKLPPIEKRRRRQNLNTSMYGRWGEHQGVSSTHRNCAFWITQMDEYDHAYVVVSLCWLSKR